MLYEKSKEKSLSPELFRNPTAEFRGAPFWAWNGRMEEPLLMKEIEDMKKMGLGGFFIHCRSGLETAYLGPKFLSLVVSCNRKARREHMLSWLYDEDRWPSGSAGGLVTRDHRYRARHLVFEPRGIRSARHAENDSSAKAVPGGERKLLACYEIRLKNGRLDGYRRLKPGEDPAPGAEGWDAFLQVAGNSPWFNNQAYVNTLDAAAVRRFVEITHETYYRTLGGEFGKSVPGIFTDEPQFTAKESLNFAEEKKSVVLPYTDDFEDTYRKAYGESLLDHLPELFWELPDGRVSVVRYRYHDHLSERFASAYADTIGRWCGEHGLMLTGHMMMEDTLESQTRALGDCMRSYRSFQLPGIDVLCDARLFSTAKQAASAAHQYGRPGVLSELYGVTNWDFDFRSHKLAGDWQAALGVTMRVHHLNWYTMAGEAKRDYPSPIGYQATWYQEYPLIENHFARLNTALTRGRPLVHVGVVHPVESYWLHWGPKDQTQLARDELENRFKNLVDWLLYGLIDFDFISESLLPSQSSAEQGTKFKVGRMQYDVVLVPGCETLRSTTLERLKSFRKSGGCVLFAGKPASLVDAERTDAVERFAETCGKIEYTRRAVLESLEPLRDLDVRESSGTRAGNLLYQMRQDGEKRWLFLCHARPMPNPDIASPEHVVIRIAGAWSPTVYDTMNGSIFPCQAERKDGSTFIRRVFYPHDSLLLLLEPSSENRTPEQERASVFEPLRGEEDPASEKGWRCLELPEPESFRLSEPNVLMLDHAEYALDSEDWQPEEELLRLGNIVRARLGFPPQNGGFAQPWTVTDREEARHTLRIRFTVNTDIPVSGAQLALERPQTAEITINGVPVSSRPEGWFVDESIQRVALPRLPAGTTQIILKVPFTKKTNTEL